MIFQKFLRDGENSKFFILSERERSLKMSKGKKLMVGMLAALMLAGAGACIADASGSVWQCRYCGKRVNCGNSNPPSAAECYSNPNPGMFGGHANHVYERIGWVKSLWFIVPARVLRSLSAAVREMKAVNGIRE